MSSPPTNSSTTPSNSSSDLRGWLCPFADTAASPSDDHHPDTHVKSGFISTALEEARHIPAIRQGFTSYQAAIDAHKPFSQTFTDNERASTATAIQQLNHLSCVFQDVVTRVAALLDDAVVPEELRAELHIARVWVAKHRASLVSCHVFFKINYSLARDKPNDGVLELCDYAVKERRRRASSVALASGHPL